MQMAIDKARVVWFGLRGGQEFNPLWNCRLLSNDGCERRHDWYFGHQCHALQCHRLSGYSPCWEQIRSHLVHRLMKHFPFLYDAATPITQRGKIEVLARAEKPVPDGWVIDQKSKPMIEFC